MTTPRVCGHLSKASQEMFHKVAKEIRRVVPRPAELPVMDAESGYWPRWGNYCPLGLCPGSRHVTPGHLDTVPALPGCSYQEMMAFTLVWDYGFKSPQEAVDAVWGRVEEAK